MRMFKNNYIYIKMITVPRIINFSTTVVVVEILDNM